MTSEPVEDLYREVMTSADQKQAGSGEFVYCRNCDARLTVPESKLARYCQDCREMPIFGELEAAQRSAREMHIAADNATAELARAREQYSLELGDVLCLYQQKKNERDALKADLERVTAERSRLMAAARQYQRVHPCGHSVRCWQNEAITRFAALDATRNATGEQVADGFRRMGEDAEYQAEAKAIAAEFDAAEGGQG